MLVPNINKLCLNGGLFLLACLHICAMFRTPKRARTISSESSDVTTTSSSDSSPIVNGNGSQDSPSPGYARSISPSVTEQHRRGRPRAEVLNSLRIQGYTSPSSIKCTYCNRVFPREKSLQAHLRTHTGERPYICDYPRCTRRFAQSGQLKTHQRLHTGEKPFLCGWSPGCPRRFTHANRHCPDHPDAQLRRCGGVVASINGNAGTISSASNSPSTEIEMTSNGCDDDQHRKEIQHWMESVKRREAKAKSMNGNPTKKSLLQALDQFSNPLDNIENYDYSNIIPSPNSLPSPGEIETSTPKNLHCNDSYNNLGHDTSPASNSALFIDDGGVVQPEEEIGTYMGTWLTGAPTQLFKEDSSSTTPSCVPAHAYGGRRSTELPKKRWLRKATLEQQRTMHQDLALPINWGEEAVTTHVPSVASTVVEVENSKRPTVLMHANQNNTIGTHTNGFHPTDKNVSSMDMQVVMALMDLKNNRSNINYRI